MPPSPTKKRKREAKTGWKKRRAGMGCCLWLQREKRLWGGGNKSCDGVRERSVRGEEGTLQGSGPGASLEDAGRDRELKSLAKGLGSNEAAK